MYENQVRTLPLVMDPKRRICQDASQGRGFRKPLEEGKLQSDSGVLWNMLEDLNLLILNCILFPPCDRSLVLWHNGVKLTASWELTFRSTFDTDCPPVFKASHFLRAVVKCQSGGYCQEYKLLSICHVQCNGAAFTLKWSCISETQNMISPVRFFFNGYDTGLASCVYLSSACEICKIETVQYVYFVNLPFL